MEEQKAGAKPRQHKPLSEAEERTATAIVDAAYKVHSALGPGLLEHVCGVCFCHELTKAGLRTDRQVGVPVVYDSITFDAAFRLDALVDDLVVCEIKADKGNGELALAQLLTYLRLTGKRLGFVINFNVPAIRKGIRRVVL